MIKLKNSESKNKQNRPNLLIYSHRGNTIGKNPSKENKVSYLNSAINLHFNVEFDINFNPAKSNLVLSHDEAETVEENNVDEFLSNIKSPQFHALNIKNTQSLVEILSKIKENSIQQNCFLFDFELLILEINQARFLMKSIQKQGFNVAYRLSEKESYFDEYLKDESVKLLWMDEFSNPWIQNTHVKTLNQLNKQTMYVSPELHGEQNMEKIKTRWGTMIESGITGICTDFPIELKTFIEHIL